MHFAEFFLPEDEMILTSRKLGANKILSSEVFNKKYQKMEQPRSFDLFYNLYTYMCEYIFIYMHICILYTYIDTQTHTYIIYIYIFPLLSTRKPTLQLILGGAKVQNVRASDNMDINLLSDAI